MVQRGRIGYQHGEEGREEYGKCQSYNGFNILKYRRLIGLSQEALAAKEGVTNQEVSKWKTAKSAPDSGF